MALNSMAPKKGPPLRSGSPEATMTPPKRSLSLNKKPKVGDVPDFRNLPPMPTNISVNTAPRTKQSTVKPGTDSIRPISSVKSPNSPSPKTSRFFSAYRRNKASIYTVRSENDSTMDEDENETAMNSSEWSEPTSPVSPTIMKKLADRKEESPVKSLLGYLDQALLSISPTPPTPPLDEAQTVETATIPAPAAITHGPATPRVSNEALAQAANPAKAGEGVDA
ncbi:hypothetical protein HK101_008451, partial [Irineochytrium annulatum]